MSLNTQPTTGVGIPAFVQIAALPPVGRNLTPSDDPNPVQWSNPLNVGTAWGPCGQGKGAFPVPAGSDNHPNAQYSLVLSLSGGSAGVSPLASAAAMAILAYSAVTGSTGAGSTVSGGNIGISPDNASSVTNFPPSTLTAPGVFHYADAAAAQAQVDLAAALAYFEALPATGSLTTADLGTQSGGGAPTGHYYAGVYVSGSSIALSSPIVLDAQGNANAVFVFYATASAITQQAAGTITLANGAQANNVYWVNGSSFTSLAGAATIGNILAHTSITLGGGTLNGRALANTGAVTMSTTEVITVPSSSGSAYNYNGQVFPSEVSLIASLVDVQNNAVGTSYGYSGDNFVWVALCSPASAVGGVMLRTNNAQRSSTGPNPTSQGAYNASVFTLGMPYGSYDADVIVQANAIGQAILKCQFPFAGNSFAESRDDGYDVLGNRTPHMGIEVEVVVTVVA